MSHIKICNSSDYQTTARLTLPKPLYEYLASGTDDEQTLTENEAAFKNWYLRPRFMRPIGNTSTSTTLFGQNLTLPVFISPAGVHALCNEDGECATARACAKVGTMFGLSQHSTKTIEEVAAATDERYNTNFWYQSYILKDKVLTKGLIDRAIRVGYKGLSFSFFMIEHDCQQFQFI